MFRIFDALRLAFERLWNHRVLVFWALVGLMAATTLALSLPLYVDAVNTRLLASRLPNPPYAFRFRYLGSWKGNVTKDDVVSARAAVDAGFTQTMGLPIIAEVNYARGGAWNTQLVSKKGNKPLGAFSVGMLEGAESQIAITAGSWPPAAVDASKASASTKAADAVIPVMIPEKMLYSMGVQ